MLIDLRDTGRQRLLKLIQNLSGSFPVAEDSIVFGTPTVTTQNSRNTSIEVNPNPDVVLDKTNFVNTSPVFKSKRTLFYNRIPFTDRFTEGLTLTAIPEGASSVHDLLAAILAEHNVNILPEDVQDTAFTSFPVTMTAATGSLGWLGSVSIIQGSTPVVNYGTFRLDDGSVFALDGPNFVFTVDEPIVE